MKVVDPVDATIQAAVLLRSDTAPDALARLFAAARSADLPPEWRRGLTTLIRQLRRIFSLAAQSEALGILGKRVEAVRKLKDAEAIRRATQTRLVVHYTAPGAGNFDVSARILEATAEFLSEKKSDVLLRPELLRRRPRIRRR